MIESLHEVIHKIEHVWPHKRLLIVGDVMLDQYIWGEVGRISPEAPVPIVLTSRRSQQPGGAANVAMNVAKLGASVVLVGFTGGDDEEVHLGRILQENGIKPAFVACENYPTITKLRILAGRQQMLRLDSESTKPRPQADHDRLLARVMEELPASHAVVLSDYAKGVLIPAQCQAIIQEAKRLGVPILVDPKSTDFTRYRGATTVCPNLQELSAASGASISDLEAMMVAAERMVTELDLEFLTATLSEKGMAVIRPGNRFLAPAAARQVFDVSGAGDTVIATLALCQASGVVIEPSVRLANIAAGIVVGKVGTVPIERYELLAALSPEIALHAEDKILALPELKMRVSGWRANGERVVFTNGCFDLLHVGHITIIEESRRQGDRLIVAINSDASVSKLKGPSRPVVGQNERARVLAALAAVDAVVVFDDPTPLSLILETKPDVIVKGGDYDESTIVGAQEVRSWGGRVAIIPILEGHSTTRLTERFMAGASDRA